MFGFNLGFDQNKYLIEQRKQIIEDKAKKALLEEENKKKIKDKEKQDIKKLIETTNNNINKIQINFHNSFVNRQTHQTYDKIIEQNNKFEFDNIINQNISIIPLSIHLATGSNQNENDIILMESYSQTANKTINEETVLVNDTINNDNNLSETIKVESSDNEDYAKEDFTYVDFKDLVENVNCV